MSRNENRVPYETIKARVMDAYYDFCRDRGLVDRRCQAEILGSVDYEFENSYELPVENLMLCVVQLVLSGGWDLDSEVYMRKRISDQLAEHGWDYFFSAVPSDEANVFRHDLSILKLV